MRKIFSALLMSQAVGQLWGDSDHFGPIIKKAISWNEAVIECSKSGGSLAYIDNYRLDLRRYQAAIGKKNFENMEKPRIWLGRQQQGWNPISNNSNRRCLKYEPHTFRILVEKCDEKMWFSCRYGPNETSKINSSKSGYFGTIIKKAISQTDAVLECRKRGGSLAYIENELDLSLYQAAIGYKDFESMFEPRVWLGNRNPTSTNNYRRCFKYEPHTENIVAEKCDEKMWFSCRYGGREFLTNFDILSNLAYLSNDYN